MQNHRSMKHTDKKYDGRKHWKNIVNRMSAGILIVASSLTLCILPGCGKRETVHVENTNQTKIEFSWWGNDTRHLYTMNGVDEFQQLNQDIAVKYRYGEWNGYEKKNKVWMESHTEADVMQINFGWLLTYSMDGEGYYDLNELSDYIELSNYTEEDLQFGERNGKLNAVPIAFNTPTMYYNQEILEKYKIDTPKTWDDLFKAAELMREDGIYPLGLPKKHLFLLVIAYYEQSTGKHAFSEDGELQLEEDDIAFMLEFYHRLYEEKVIMPIENFSNVAFSAGEVAGTMIWISDTDNYCGGLEKEGGTPVLGDYPTVSGGTLTGWYRKPATMYAISKNTAHPEEAARLLDYLVNSPEMARYQKTEKGVPVSQNAVATLEEEGLLNTYGNAATEKMNEYREEMQIMIPAMENDSIITAFKDGAEAYYYEQMSIEEAASQIYSEMTEILGK